jgi:hypothetical protein
MESGGGGGTGTLQGFWVLGDTADAVAACGLFIETCEAAGGGCISRAPATSCTPVLRGTTAASFFRGGRVVVCA